MRSSRALLALTTFVASGCATILGIEDKPIGDAGSDVGASSRDAAADADVAVEAGGEGGSCRASSGGPFVEVGTAGARFCIDATEVTRRQYDEFLKSSPKAVNHPRCTFKDGSAAPCTTNAVCTGFEPTRQVPGAGWPYNAAEADLPVLYVDWCDAYAYCEWAGKRLCGRIGGGPLASEERLDPSKNQWYQACSENAARSFAYGSSFVDGTCNGPGQSPFIAGSRPTCQGGYPGVYDLSGNVFELTDLCTLGSTPESDRCIAWGGSFIEPQNASCIFIASLERGRRFENVGFRCCSR